MRAMSIYHVRPRHVPANAFENPGAEQAYASALAPRLLCIYPWLTLGGADKFNLDMLTELHKRGWQIEIVTTLKHSHPWRDRFAALCTRITDLGEIEPQSQPAHLLAAITAAQPDVLLISHSRLGYALLPYLRAHFPHISWVDYNHLVDPDDPQGGYPFLSIQQRQALDLQIVSSQALASWMLAHGGEAERIAICTTNVDTQHWNPDLLDRGAIRRQLGIPEQAFVGLYAARFESIKQPVESLEIMRRVVGATHDTYFLLAGSGSYEPYLRSRLRHSSLGQRIQLLGAVSNERIRELLAASDVLLLSSRGEGISLAIYEAMAMGVVPVSVDASGQAELVTPACGILIKHSSQDIQNYTTALLKLAHDRQGLSAMSKACRQRVSMDYRLEQMGERMHELLLTAMHLHHEQPRPMVSAEQARNAARNAVRLAEQARGTPTGMQALRNIRRFAQRLYWQLVERGAWWLVPGVERVRAAVRRHKIAP